MLPSTAIRTSTALLARSLRPAPAVAAALVALTAAPALAAAPGVILFHADLDGNFAVPECGRARQPAPDFAALVAVMARARQEAAEPPLTLLGGNVASPGLFGRDLVAGDRAAAPGRGLDTIAALLARAGYQAVAVGHHDLSLGAARLAALATALRARGMPLLATNLSCDETRRTLCAALRPQVVVGDGEQRTAVLAVMAPSLLPGIPAAAREGLRLVPMHEAAVQAITRARAAGARRVVLLVDVPRSWAGAEEAAVLQARFAAGPAPDVILAGGFAGRGELRTLRLLEQDGAPPVVGSTAGATGVARIELTEGGVARVTALEPAPAPAPAAARDEETAALMAPLEAAYCRRHGRVVGAGPVRGEITREQWLSYVLAVMRRAARAEVALLNRDFVRREPFPLRGRLTRIDLRRAMPYVGVVGTGRVPGARLASLLGPAMANPRLATIGVEGGTGGKALTINGRALDSTRSYRVATIAFVAAGGDDLLPAGALPFAPLAGGPDLAGLVDRFLATETAAEDGDPAIDPATDFGRPAAERTLLVALGDLALDLGQTSISGRAGHTAPQLTRAEQRSIKGELTAVGQLRSRRHEGDARLRVLYGHARSQPADQPSVSAETADLLSLSTLYDYRGLRDMETAVPRPAVPDPYLRLLLESELTRPAVTATQSRDYHHAELTATTGALFTVTPKLRLRGGVGARQQLLAPGPAGRVRPLIEAGGSLDSVPLFTFAGVAARLEGLFDYVFVDPLVAREHQLKATARVAVPILPLLFVTAGVDLFAEEIGGNGWGAAYDTSVGLRLHLDRARQSLGP